MPTSPAAGRELGIAFARQQRIELAGAVQRVQLVAAADMRSRR